MSTYVLAEELGARRTAADTVVIGKLGGGDRGVHAGVYSAPLGQRVISTGGLGAMGFGLPASIAHVQLPAAAAPFFVDGDGGFHLNIQELATPRRLSLSMKIFVLDNHGYGSIRAMQRRHFDGRLVGSDTASGLMLPDLLRLAAAYGSRTAHAASHDALAGGAKRCPER